MNQQNAQALTLFDLLARRWQASAAIADVRFTADGTAAAFATADGSVLIDAAPDPEPPETRIRVTGDLGQITVRPRTRDAAPLVTVSGLADGAPPLAAAGPDFLVGDAEGRVLRLSPDGATTPVLTLPETIVALDHAAGVTAATDAGSLALAGPEGERRWDFPGLRTLALAPDGRRIAAANAAQLVLVDDDVRTVPLFGATRLAWRGDGAWIAAALGAAGLALVDAAEREGVREGERRGDPGPIRLRDFPAPVRSLGWSAAGGVFVASGAFRIAAWDAGALPATDRPLVTGQSGLVVVEAVAVHPTRALVAAGFANGQVVIAQIGSRDELLLRQTGASVTCLAFSADGRHLAIGDADGSAAVASFPPQMFK